MRAFLPLSILFATLASGCLAETSDAGADLESTMPAQIDWGDPEDAALRPGDKLYGPHDPAALPNTFLGCTVNFVFVDEQGAAYIGTASHCVKGRALGDPIQVAGRVAATLHYCGWGAFDNVTTCTDKAPLGGIGGPEPGFEHDFALLRINHDEIGRVHPAVRVWGAPTGMAKDLTVGMPVRTYGNSGLRDGGTESEYGDAREGVLTEVSDWQSMARFSVPSIAADSGSPVMTADGLALGVVQTLSGAENGIINLGPALDFYHARAGPGLSLAT